MRIEAKTGVIKVSRNDMVDLMSAVLQGIGYWIAWMEAVDRKLLGKSECVEDYVASGGAERIWISEPFEEKDGKPVETYDITIDVLKRGLALWLDGGYDRYKAYDRETGRIDFCDVDADMADIIVQCGLFGDVVFG